MRKIRVTASKEYDVIIDAGLLERSAGYVGDVVKGNMAVIVTDETVGELYGARLTDTLSEAGFKTLIFTVSSGEASKNMRNYTALLNFLAENGVAREDAVIALGGGVVGDLAGFAAATYMRGVRFIQLPTTLLAAVDSSVGGKTAVDLDAGKNLAGAFYQPDLVLCDYSLLETLPDSVFADGCAEVIKYGVIADADLFDSLRGGINSKLEEIIARCVSIKRDVVCEDEFETGARKLLNFGHTVGHAIELCSAYKIPHGAAVAAGMAIITRAAAAMGLCGAECGRKLENMLKSYGLPCNTEFQAGELSRAALADKKRQGGYITLIIPKKIGECCARKTPVEELEYITGLGLADGGTL